VNFVVSSCRRVVVNARSAPAVGPFQPVSACRSREAGAVDLARSKTVFSSCRRAVVSS